LDTARSRKCSGPAQQERVTDTASPMTLIQMGGRCSEELTPKSSETTTRVKMEITQMLDATCTASQQMAVLFP